MTSHHSSLVEHVLSHVTLDRLSKAVTGLANNTYTITLITNTDTDISGLVKNGDGVEYGVSLLPGRVFCSCRDSMFRHTICKHTIVLALHALRTPADRPQSQQPIAHLMRVNARAVVCGERYPERIMYWPWPETIVNNQTQWPEITVCPDCIRNRYPVGHETINGAPDLHLGKVRAEHGSRSAF